MNNIGIFLNNRITVNDNFSIPGAVVAFGDWCLTPVRCLFNGNEVIVSTANDTVNVRYEKEYFSRDMLNSGDHAHR